jgi:hypothetical protein
MIVTARILSPMRSGVRAVAALSACCWPTLRQRVRNVRQGPDGLLFVITDEDAGSLCHKWRQEACLREGIMSTRSRPGELSSPARARARLSGDFSERKLLRRVFQAISTSSKEFEVCPVSDDPFGRERADQQRQVPVSNGMAECQ